MRITQRVIGGTLNYRAGTGKSRRLLLLLSDQTRPAYGESRQRPNGSACREIGSLRSGTASVAKDGHKPIQGVVVDYVMRCRLMSLPPLLSGRV